MLARLRYGSLVIPASDFWRFGGAFLAMDSVIPSRLCGKAGVLQRKSQFAKFAAVSVSVQNIGGKFFRPIGRVSGITTNFPSYNSEQKTSSRLGDSVGSKTMW